MTSRAALPITAFACTLLIASCGDRAPRAARPVPESEVESATAKPGAAAPASPTATAPPRSFDRWLGQWIGVEGTFLRLAGGNGTYEVTIQDLDGPRTFSATAVDGKLQFERDGVRETLRETNGVETGMKWLAEKSNCLTIRPGEGFCRP
ncbi:MAG: hypothetical protein ABIV06_07170 [Thermoanaerobaculia bacterium]